MRTKPIHLSYDHFKGFKLCIQVCFNQAAYTNRLNELCYKDLIEHAVTEKWSGEYAMTDALQKSCSAFLEKYQPDAKISSAHKDLMPFTVEVITDPLSGVYSPRILYVIRLLQKEIRPVPIFLGKSKIIPSHVASGLWRRFWGFVRYGRIVTLGLNWSRNFPGFAVIQKSQNLANFKSVSAHEFGHLFGLDDAYNAWYRFYYAAPGTEDYMMHYNRKVHEQEIAMLIKAYAKNRMQFFPVKFKGKNIISGFKDDLKYYARKIKEISWKDKSSK